MPTRSSQKNERRGERGAVAVYTALILTVLIGFTALAVDVGHLYGVRNELNNAADAAALAGAHKLFDDAGDLTVAAAKAEAARVAKLNRTGDVMLAETTNFTVKVGHWSFTTKTFEQKEPAEQLSGWEETSFKDLDGNVNFINAVEVTTKREDTPSFFARIFAFDQFLVQSKAVAYIGFAGTLFPLEVDEPVAVCEESIKVDDHYECNIGRMIPSTGDTAYWTDFAQTTESKDVCKGGADATGVEDAIHPSDCEGGNTKTLLFGVDMALIEGEVSKKGHGNLMDCWWKNSEEGTIPWELVLPVIDCNRPTCAELVGAVIVRVVWITGLGTPKWEDVPTEMGDWSSTTADGELRWAEFVEHFKLKDADGKPAPYQKKSIYFQPSCEKIAPRGKTGGENFGIMAKIPVLVQ